jgi:hypothetical protein
MFHPVLRVACLLACLGLVMLGSPGFVRAQEASPAASPLAGEVQRETLYTLTLPADVIPGEPGGTAFLRFTVAPGTSFDFSPPCWVSPAVDVWYVEAGTFTIRPAAPATVLRSADQTTATTEPVAADAEVVLSPGDRLLYVGLPAVPGVFRNPGPEPVTGLVWGVWGAAVAGCPPIGMVEPWVSYVDGREWTLPPGPLTLTLQRLTLVPGASAAFPASDPEAAGLVLDYVEQGVAAYTGEGAGRRLRNAGEEPLIALALTLTPAGARATPMP